MNEADEIEQLIEQEPPLMEMLGDVKLLSKISDKSFIFRAKESQVEAWINML
ncbi:hypothetical protein [Virgibacillus sp. CBA3643]|uniref:hypothetical protein n=1 Tax=Virgibacillus sp. CBA3643 TaxID=2942278 RepID=UPI0035A3D2C6